MPNVQQIPLWGKKLKRPSLWVADVGHRDGVQGAWGAGRMRAHCLTPPALMSPTRSNKMTGLQVTRLQSAVIPHFHGVGVRVVKGTLQMGSGLAL